MSDPCAVAWSFDVEFDAYCNLPVDHTGKHRAEVVGNGDVVAQVEWPN